ESTNTTEELVEDLRALYLVMAEFARRKYGNDLESQQEVLMKLSDLAIHLYASESVVLRTEKSTQNKALKKQLRDTVLEEAVNQTFLIVRQLEQELLEDEQAIRQQIYASLTSHSFSQSIHRNRNIAETMYEKGEYAGESFFYTETINIYKGAKKMEVDVRVSETDLLGHVNHANYFTYMEEGRLSFLKELGLQVEDEGFSIMLASAKCDFIRQGYFNQTIIVNTEVTRVGNS